MKNPEVSENLSMRSIILSSLLGSTTIMMSISFSELIWGLFKKCVCLKPTSQRNIQTVLMISLLVLPLFPILTLIVQYEVSLSYLINSKIGMEVNELFFRKNEEMSNCNQKLQEKRSYASFLLSLARSNGSNISEHHKLIQNI